MRLYSILYRLEANGSKKYWDINGTKCVRIKCIKLDFCGPTQCFLLIDKIDNIDTDYAPSLNETCSRG